MGSLHTALFTTLDQYKFNERERPIQAFPIAYPLIESTWRLRERRTTRIGLVQRHLLRALDDLGPSTISALNDIYCLGEQEITDTFNEMLRDGAPIVFQGGAWQRIPSKQNDTPDCFVCEETHEREFLQDGLTGEPLPIDFLEMCKSILLFPLENDPEKMVDRKKRPVRVRQWFSPPFSEGLASMRSLVESVDRERRTLIGIPEGAFALADTAPDKQKNTWVLAFIFLHQDGTAQIAHELGPAVKLPGRNFADLNAYLGTFSWFRSKLDAEEKLAADESAPWIAKRSAGKMIVSLEKIDPPMTLRDFKSNDSGDSLRFTLAQILARGEDWDSRSGMLATVIPNDKDTARTMVLFRSVLALRKELFHPSDPESRLTGPEGVAHFLSRCQQTVLDSLPNSVRCEKITLEEILREIRLFPNQEFVEEFSSMTGQSRRDVGRKPTSRQETSFLRNFHTGSDECRELGEAVLEAIHRAKKRIYLISPAVELFGELRQELESALRRGVEIRLLTQLSDSGAVHLPLPTRGNPGEKHSMDHVREMSILGVLCRQPRFYCHAKMLLSDSEVILSSANLNKNSLGYGPQNSIEAGLRSGTPFLLGHAEKLFKAVWQSSPTRQHFLGGKVNITENPATAISPDILVQEADGCKLLLPVPSIRWTLTEELVRSIDAARKSVRLCALSIWDTKKIPTLHSSLIAACRRKVEVTVFVRKDYFKSEAWPDPSTKELLQEGVCVRLVDGLHAKLLDVDECQWGCFSGNLNPYSLSSTEPTAHLEMGLFGSDSSVQEAIVRFINQCVDASAPLST